MVSLDNLKTAVSAIKSEINSIASRYLKKTDANNIYITKKSADKSFATKSSVPNLSYFNVAQSEESSILELTESQLKDLRLYDANSDIPANAYGIVYKHYKNGTIGDLSIQRGSNLHFTFIVGNAESVITEFPNVGGLGSGVFWIADLEKIRKVAYGSIDELYKTRTGDLVYRLGIYVDTNPSYKVEVCLKRTNEIKKSTEGRLCGFGVGSEGELYYVVTDSVNASETPEFLHFTVSRIV